MLSGFVTLLLFTVAGEAISAMFNLPVPGAVTGLILLLIWLRVKGGVSDNLQKVSQFCIHYMAVLFIPSAVAIFFMAELLSRQWLPLVLATFVATPVGIVVSGHFMQWLLRRGEKQ
ncbi:CidA/LrgA family protein [Endozoicomonas euniceicola]|uniref:CidA/LrgA family protein n=1 Tax=Endozoicomonas euniceicola TaxID=1234143 RepID=A0ABY6GX69_9GAMM|nr:CidA/LrgA family protein [Endozoicomonas euniceicola]UYM17380.1 CidA/LrgA family protein [Endozoicomonas euniceicola]